MDGTLAWLRRVRDLIASGASAVRRKMRRQGASCTAEVKLDRPWHKLAM